MQQTKERVALGSIVASAGLTIAKLIVGLLSGSLAILSEAAHSLVDVVATVMTYFAVRVSGKPADAEHHYGHGKVESVSALAETALLFLLCGVVVWEAARRLFGTEEHAVEAGLWSFGVIVGSVVVDFLRARLLYRVAAETSSEALEADALHFSSDMWSSLAVLAGLIGVRMGYSWADPAAALIVAVFVCLAGWRLTLRTIATLTDEAPAGMAERIGAVAEKVEGVVEVERVRVRPSGPMVFVDLSLGVSRMLPLDRVTEVKNAVISALQAELPRAEVAVTTNPRALDGETVVERVLAIARNRNLAVHHVTVHALGERLAISLDLEVDRHLTLGAAHDIATGLENAICDELGSQVEVETHIEPLQIEDAAGTDAPPERSEDIRRTLASLASEAGTLRHIHEVRVRETSQGEVVNFHCDVDATMTVDAVHDAVDDLERALRKRLPTVKRVIGHAEPRPR